jgi:hypothetical protein
MSTYVESELGQNTPCSETIGPFSDITSFSVGRIFATSIGKITSESTVELLEFCPQLTISREDSVIKK